MPNWVDTDIYVKGKKENVDKVNKYMEKFFVEEDEKIYKGNDIAEDLIPSPKECDNDKFDIDLKKWDTLTKEQKDEHEKLNVFCNDWHEKNWGANSVLFDLKKVNEKESKENKRIKYNFKTRWTPVIPIFKKLAEKFDNVDMEMRFYEMGQQFKGNIKYKKGKKISSTIGKYFGKRGG